MCLKIKGKCPFTVFLTRDGSWPLLSQEHREDRAVQQWVPVWSFGSICFGAGMAASSPRRRGARAELCGALEPAGMPRPGPAWRCLLFLLVPAFSLPKVQRCFASRSQTLQVNESLGLFCYHLKHNRSNRL